MCEANIAYILAERRGRGLIWPSLLGLVLKGGWPTNSASTSVANIKQQIEIARKFRSRVSHHEPVWKKFNVLDEKGAIITWRRNLTPWRR